MQTSSAYQVMNIGWNLVLKSYSATDHSDPMLVLADGQGRILWSRTLSDPDLAGGRHLNRIVLRRSLYVPGAFIRVKVYIMETDGRATDAMLQMNTDGRLQEMAWDT